MISHRCNKCLWFDHEHDTLAPSDSGLGYCRKHKPMVFQHEKKFYGAWPLVDVEDFCGEFRPDIDEES